MINFVYNVVAKVLGRDTRDRQRFDALHSFAKNKLTDYRTEERRKVRVFLTGMPYIGMPYNFRYLFIYLFMYVCFLFIYLFIYLFILCIVIFILF